MGFFNFRKKTKKGSTQKPNPQIAFVDKNLNSNAKNETVKPDVDSLLKDYSYFTHSIFSESLFGDQGFSSDEKFCTSSSSSFASEISSIAGKNTLSDSPIFDARSDSMKASSTNDSAISDLEQGKMVSHDNNSNSSSTFQIESKQCHPSSQGAASACMLNNDPTLITTNNATLERNVNDNCGKVNNHKSASKKEVDRPDIRFISDKDGKDWYAHTMERMRKRHRQDYRMSAQRMVNMGDTAIIPTPRTTSLIHYSGYTAPSRRSIQLSLSQTRKSVPEERNARRSVLQVFNPYQFHQFADTEPHQYRRQCHNATVFSNDRSRQSYSSNPSVRAASPHSYTESYRGSFLNSEPINFTNIAMQLRQQRHNTYRYSHKTALPDPPPPDNSSEKHSSKILVSSDCYPDSFQGHHHHPLNTLDHQYPRKSERISDIISLFPEANNTYVRPNEYSRRDRYSQQYITSMKSYSPTNYPNTISSVSHQSQFNRASSQPPAIEGYKYHHLPKEQDDASSYTSVNIIDIPAYRVNSQQCSHHRSHYTMLNRRQSTTDRPRSLKCSSRSTYCQHQNQPTNNSSSRHSCHSIIHGDNSGDVYHHSHRGNSSNSVYASCRSSHSHNKRRHSSHYHCQCSRMVAC